MRWIYGLNPSGIELGLTRVKRALDLLGSPHAGYAIVTVAGTNGKGSTVKFLASIIDRAGYRVGVYTSPHLRDIRERICLGSMWITPREFVAALTPIRELLHRHDDLHLTFFEVLTVMALCFFRARDVDVAILEVGLGGRLDATAAVPADVAVITNIALDHQDYLGESLELICREKAGIICEGAVVVTGVSSTLFRNVVGPIAFDKRCPIRRSGVDFTYRWMDDLGFRFRGWINRLGPVHLGISGTAQGDNAALACAAAESLASRGFYFKPVQMAEGLLRARHGGRMERREACLGAHGQPWPAVLLDGAHNPAATRLLATELPEQLPERPRVMVFGVKKGKNTKAMLDHLASEVDCVILTTANEGQEFSRETLRDLDVQLPRVLFEPDLQMAVHLARTLATAAGGVLITGSLYLVGDALEHLPDKAPLGVD